MAVPAPSATVTSATEKLLVSSSVIVIVWDCVPLSVALPPDTPVTAIIAVSFASSIESFVGVNETVPVVAPALIVISSILPEPSV